MRAAKVAITIQEDLLNPVRGRRLGAISVEELDRVVEGLVELIG